MNLSYNAKTDKWEEAESIPYYRPCLAKRIGAKILWFLFGCWLKEKHHDI